MRHILTILAALFLCATAQAQTVKALSYGTNGRFITGTNVLIFTNSISLAQGDFQISESGMIRWGGADRMEVETYTLYGPWNFDQPAAVRTNLGIPLIALTNTSNVTVMRALSGSTNTNHPYSGTVALTNTNAVLTFSNGILQSVQ